MAAAAITTRAKTTKNLTFLFMLNLPLLFGLVIFKFGFVFDRQAAGSHEIWYNSKTKKYTTIPNHPGDIPEGTLRAILKQADIEPDNFLSENR